MFSLELVSKELNHLAAILYGCAGVWILWSKTNILLLLFKKKILLLLQWKVFKKSKIAQIYCYDPQSTGINLQSLKSDSTPWTPSLVFTIFERPCVRAWGTEHVRRRERAPFALSFLTKFWIILTDFLTIFLTNFWRFFWWIFWRVFWRIFWWIFTIFERPCVRAWGTEHVRRRERAPFARRSPFLLSSFYAFAFAFRKDCRSILRSLLLFSTPN